MTIILPLLLVVMMVGIFAALMREGLWSNAIALVNVIVAGLVATNFFEPLAAFLTKQWPKMSIFTDILALWALFAVTYLVLRVLTDLTSKFRVRFKKPIEDIGNYALALAVAYVAICFTTMTLHTVPLARNFLWKGFRPEDPLLFMLKPDRQWLGFTQMVSGGSLARMTSEKQPEQYLFDPKGEFMPKYASRREQYETQVPNTPPPMDGKKK
jgi:uncharacterized membrane protein required for colicin V production